jgi:hypothetical protein
MNNQLAAQNNLAHSFDFDSARDRDNPRALINIVPTVAANALRAIPDELFDLSLPELKAKIGEDDIIDMLRTSWWIEYNRAQKTNTMFNLSNVFSGLTWGSKFANKYLGNSYKFLYIITPPVDYNTQQHQILNLALEAEMKVLKLPIMKAVYNKEGAMIGEEVDSKLLAIQQKIAENVKNRIMGMPVNRTMQINQNFNTNTNAPSSPFGEGTKPIEHMDETELQEYVDRLKGEKGLKDINVAKKG